MSKGWMQFLFVAVPVLSLVGSWLALRTLSGRAARRSAPSAGDQQQANNS